MEKKDQTDYAAAYRQFCTYGHGRTFKAFCSEEDFNYSKLRRYIDKLAPQKDVLLPHFKPPTFAFVKSKSKIYV